jgi:hypothetical protein
MSGDVLAKILGSTFKCSPHRSTFPVAIWHRCIEVIAHSARPDMQAGDLRLSTVVDWHKPQPIFI